MPIVIINDTKSIKGHLAEVTTIHVTDKNAVTYCGLAPHPTFMKDINSLGDVVDVPVPATKMLRISHGQIIDGMEWCYVCANWAVRHGVISEDIVPPEIIFTEWAVSQDHPHYA